MLEKVANISKSEFFICSKLGLQTKFPSTSATDTVETNLLSDMLLERNNAKKQFQEIARRGSKYSSIDIIVLTIWISKPFLTERKGLNDLSIILAARTDS